MLHCTFSTEPERGGREFQGTQLNSKRDLSWSSKSNWSLKMGVSKKLESQKLGSQKIRILRLGVSPCTCSILLKILNFKQAQSEPSMWRHLRACYFDFFEKIKWGICGWDTSAGSLKNFKIGVGLIFSAGGSPNCATSGGALLEFEIRTSYFSEGSSYGATSGATFIKRNKIKYKNESQVGVLEWRHLKRDSEV